MTAIERTAYSRFKRNLTAKDLAEVYTPNPAERFLAARRRDIVKSGFDEAQHGAALDFL